MAVRVRDWSGREFYDFEVGDTVALCNYSQEGVGTVKGFKQQGAGLLNKKRYVIVDVNGENHHIPGMYLVLHPACKAMADKKSIRQDQ